LLKAGAQDTPVLISAERAIASTSKETCSWVLYTKALAMKTYPTSTMAMMIANVKKK
jgi:hypothetical protein